MKHIFCIYSFLSFPNFESGNGNARLAYALCPKWSASALDLEHIFTSSGFLLESLFKYNALTKYFPPKVTAHSI